MLQELCVTIRRACSPAVVASPVRWPQNRGIVGGANAGQVRVLAAHGRQARAPDHLLVQAGEQLPMGALQPGGPSVRAAWLRGDVA